MFGFGSKKPAEEQGKEKITFHTTDELEKEIEHFDAKSSPGSTTLTPHELYLLKQIGMEAVQVVFGNVVYSMGVRGLLRTVWRALSRGEMVDFSRLNKDARLLARNRMVDEAKKLGATLVVGVRIDTREYADFMEVVATGTACRKIDKPPAEPQVGHAEAAIPHTNGQAAPGVVVAV